MHPDLPDKAIIGRIEVRDDVPQSVKFALVSDSSDREIRQSDLRSIEINSLVIDLMAALSIHIDQNDPALTAFRSSLPSTDGPGATYTGSVSVNVL